MDNIKSNTGNHKAKADAGRRSFMWKAGAAMSAVLAAAIPGVSKAGIPKDENLKNRVNLLSNQLGVLEDVKAIHALHQKYEKILDNGSYGEALDLFTDNSEVVFNGGIFKGRNRGISRLYNEHFKSGLTGKRMDQAPGFQLTKEQDSLEVASDRKSAKASFTYSIQVGAPMDPESLLVQMAQIQGEGIVKWWEGGVYKISYVKDIKHGGWKIKRLEYKTLSRADYRPGKSYANPVSISEFSKVYPEEPAGPDKLVKKG
ncbi:nuclear transport factor 2 family protein [Thermodesulfobacteriota bacterium]